MIEVSVVVDCNRCGATLPPVKGRTYGNTVIHAHKEALILGWAVFLNPSFKDTHVCRECLETLYFSIPCKECGIGWAEISIDPKEFRQKLMAQAKENETIRDTIQRVGDQEGWNVCPGCKENVG